MLLGLHKLGYLLAELTGTSSWDWFGDMLVPSFIKLCPRLDNNWGRESRLTDCTSFICTCSFSLLGMLKRGGCLI